MLFSQVRQYIKGLLSRTFSNKSVLDKLNESDNKLTYNGNQVSDFENLTNRPVKEITSISDIISPLPSTQMSMPILYDETGTEYVIGWYKRASDEKKKPVYKKTFTELNVSVPIGSRSTAWTNLVSIPNCDEVMSLSCFTATKQMIVMNEINILNDNIQVLGTYESRVITKVVIEYTKTTDSWQ